MFKTIFLATTALTLHASASSQNLTSYLLTAHASYYHNVTTFPDFFHRVINGTVTEAQVAYFFEQDTIYGRGFTSLCGNTLNLLSHDLTAPTSNRTLMAIDNLGQTTSGLADEDGRLTTLREQLQPGSKAKPLVSSNGTREYVQYMKNISMPPNTAFEAFVCSWTMGKVSSRRQSKLVTDRITLTRHRHSSTSGPISRAIRLTGSTRSRSCRR